MEGIKHANLIEVGAVDIEVWGIENSKLVVHVKHKCATWLSWLLTQTVYLDPMGEDAILMILCMNLSSTNTNADQCSNS